MLIIPRAIRVITALIAVWLGFSQYASAQTMTDVVNVTVGGVYLGPTGAGYWSGRFGSASPGVTSNGYSYQYIVDNGSYTRMGVGVPPSSQLAIKFPSNPGQAWLSSVTANGVTTAGSSATYSYSAGVAIWNWTTTSWNISSGSAQLKITHLAPPLGYLDLKYQIVGIDYAPPGAKSTVTYGTNTVRGTATTNTNTYKTEVQVTATYETDTGLKGVGAAGITTTLDLDYQQISSNGSSVTITNTTAFTDVVPGPSSSTLGVDHDYDVIWVWLNPEAAVYVGTNTVSLAGYAYNDQDDQFGAEVVPIQVRQLKNPSLMSAGLVQRLSRSWDTTGLGGLTTSDYSVLLAADPFAMSATYNPATDSTHRFQAATSETVPYVPPAPGGQPLTVTGTFTTQTATSNSQSATHQYSVGFSVTFSGDGNIYGTDLSADLKIAATYTTTDMWSSTLNSTVGKTASYSVTGPQASDNYTGPVSFQVYRDNVYGSFMFYPL
ncbi:MAG: hypothetical protein JSS29_07195 [Proteobacteria bacterium]|nr:hypothetical protein [Pseudomonadota bacterium]